MRPIVLACDDAYGMQLATTLRSAVEANRSGCPLECHVLSHGVTDLTKARVHASLPEGSAAISWIPVDLVSFDEYATAAHISKMTYARLLLPQIFTGLVSRVLYLDADTIVLDDLSELWETELQGAVLGAVADRLDSQIKANDPAVRNVPRVEHYFNAGVLLVDLDQWRREQVSERAMAWLADHPTSPFSDQDALNVVCDRRWVRLPTRWNFQDHLTVNLNDLARSPRLGIVHFITNLKPWEPSSLSVNCSFYDGFRSRTHFARTTGDIIRDEVRRWWCAMKSVLKRPPLVRSLVSKVRRLNSGRLARACAK